MKVGLTYDLRAEYLALGYDDQETAEFDRADTIDAIEGSLRALGHVTEPIGSVISGMSNHPRFRWIPHRFRRAR